MSEVNKGRHLSAETRRKMSEAKKGANHPLYGKHRSVETRRKMSEALKGKHRSVETRKKMSEAKKGNSYRSRPVICVETLERFASATEAAKAIGLRNMTSICNACRGVHKTAGGYHWAYVDVEKTA